MATNHYSGQYGNWTRHEDRENGDVYWANDDNPDQVVQGDNAPGSDGFLQALYGDNNADNPGAGNPNLSNVPGTGTMARNPYGIVDYGGDVGQSVYTRSPTLVYNQDTGQSYVQNPDGSTRAATSADANLPKQNFSREAGNAGHGSWWDQQGTEIMGDVLYGVAGFITGGVSQLLLSAFGDDGSAEGKRNATAGAVGGLASNFGGGDSSSTDYGAGEGNYSDFEKAGGMNGSTSATTTNATGVSSGATQTAGVADTPSAALNDTTVDPNTGFSTNAEVDPNTGFTVYPGSTPASTPAPTPPPTQSPSLVDQVMKWGHDNPKLASGALQVGGGLLKGYADNAAANKRLDKTIQAQKDLEQQRLQNQISMQQFLRQFTQSGSFFDTALPFRPGTPVLTRPGGAPVYTSNGLIAAGARR